MTVVRAAPPRMHRPRTTAIRPGRAMVAGGANDGLLSTGALLLGDRGRGDPAPCSSLASPPWSPGSVDGLGEYVSVSSQLDVVHADRRTWRRPELGVTPET